MRPFLKKGDPSQIVNYRPISLTCTLCKILERIIKNHLESFFISNDIIPDHQYGFTKSKSVTSQMIETLDDWTNALDNKKCVDTVYFDIRKAFDNINHARLIQKLYNVGVKGNTLLWISNFLTNRTFNVSIGGSSSETQNLNRGVPQGSVLGPLLFNFYIADIEQLSRSFDDITLKFFADDLKAYVIYEPTESAPHTLQNFISKFKNWCIDNDLSIAIEKCNILHLGKRNPKFNYVLDNNLIPKVLNQVRDLGFLITPKLKWSVHIKKRCSTAFGKFFSLLKVFRTIDPKQLVKLYKIYVRPVLESSSPVFNNISKKEKILLENVQKRVTRAIFNRCYKRSYPNPPPYHTRLAILDLELLEIRRLKADLVFFHKIILSEIKISNRNRPLINTGLNTRRHSLKFILPHANTKLRFNSFILRTARHYSKLPNNITTVCNSKVFRNSLKNDFMAKILKSD